MKIPIVSILLALLGASTVAMLPTEAIGQRNLLIVNDSDLTEASNQDNLLIVNDSDPAAVTFTATTNAPLVSDSTHSFNTGIDLGGFFIDEADPHTIALGPTSLTTSIDGAPVYDHYMLDDLFGNPQYETGTDLFLFTTYSTSGAFNTETFSTASPAFEGEATVDFSVYTGFLPAAGTTGDLYAGFSNASPVIIGSYEVVPEANPRVLLLSGGLILLLASQLRTRFLSQRAF